MTSVELQQRAKMHFSVTPNQSDTGDMSSGKLIGNAELRTSFLYFIDIWMVLFLVSLCFFTFYLVFEVLFTKLTASAFCDIPIYIWIGSIVKFFFKCHLTLSET